MWINYGLITVSIREMGAGAISSLGWFEAVYGRTLFRIMCRKRSDGQ